MKLFLFIFHNVDQSMQMSSTNLDISEEDNKLKSALSLMLQNSFTVAASDIFCFEWNFISNFFNKIAKPVVQSELLMIYLRDKNIIFSKTGVFTCKFNVKQILTYTVTIRSGIFIWFKSIHVHFRSTRFASTESIQRIFIESIHKYKISAFSD